MPRSNIIPFGQPVDYEERFVRERVDLYDSFRAMPQSAARAGRASHRARILGLGHAATIAIAVFCVVWFAGQLLRAVLS